MSPLRNSILVVLFLLFWGGNALAGEGGGRILFDQGHNQRFLIEEKGDLQLSKFADTIRGKGYQVASTKKPLSDDILKDTTALIISGPFESLRPDEVDAVMRFIEGGGRLAAMLHIGPPLGGVLARLGVDHSNAILHERSNVIDTDMNFRVSDLSGSPLFAGLTHFSAYGCWALDPGNTAAAIAKTSPAAWVDLDGNKVLTPGDATGAFAVAVSGARGSGSFVVFGDDAVFQNRFFDDNNGRLAANLAMWLGER